MPKKVKNVVLTQLKNIVTEYFDSMKLATEKVHTVESQCSTHGRSVHLLSVTY